MKSDISLKVIDEIKCPFCPDKVKDHSHKDLKRHFHKMYGAAVGGQKLCQDFMMANGRLEEDLSAYKEKFGEISIEELDEIKKKLIEDQKKKQLDEAPKLIEEAETNNAIEKEIADHHE